MRSQPGYMAGDWLLTTSGKHTCAAHTAVLLRGLGGVNGSLTIPIITLPVVAAVPLGPGARTVARTSVITQGLKMATDSGRWSGHMYRDVLSLLLTLVLLFILLAMGWEVPLVLRSLIPGGQRGKRPIPRLRLWGTPLSSWWVVLILRWTASILRSPPQIPLGMWPRGRLTLARYGTGGWRKQITWICTTCRRRLMLNTCVYMGPANRSRSEPHLSVRS